MDFVYIIMINLVAGAPRREIIAAAKAVADAGGDAAKATAAARAAVKASVDTEAYIEITATLQSIAGVQADRIRRKAISAANDAAKVAKDAAISRGLGDEEARAKARDAADAAYAAALPTRVADVLAGRRIRGQLVARINAGSSDSRDIGLSEEFRGLMGHDLAPVFRAGAVAVLNEHGFVLPATVAGRKPAYASKFVEDVDAAWLEAGNRVLFGRMTGYAPAGGGQLIVRTDDLLNQPTAGEEDVWLSHLVGIGLTIRAAAPVFSDVVTPLSAEAFAAEAAKAARRPVSLVEAFAAAKALNANPADRKSSTRKSSAKARPKPRK